MMCLPADQTPKPTDSAYVPSKDKTWEGTSTFVKKVWPRGSMNGSQVPRLLSARSQWDQTGLPTHLTVQDSPRFSSAHGPHSFKDFIKGMALVTSHFAILSFWEGEGRQREIIQRLT